MSTLSTAITGAAARPSRIRVVLQRVVRSLSDLWRARRHRREVSDLLRFDDRMLKDIGLTRSDVVGVLTGSAAVDPSVGLRLRRGESRVQPHGRDGEAPRVTHPEPRASQDAGLRLAA